MKTMSVLVMEMPGYFRQTSDLQRPARPAITYAQYKLSTSEVDKNYAIS